MIYNMTKEEKINNILIALKESTECGATEWKLRESCFNSEKTHNYRAYSIDKETHFDIEISLNETLSGLRSFGNAIWIYNTGLIDGKKYISSNDITKQIENLVYLKYIKPNTVSKAEDDTLDRVLNSIGDKSYMRDKKLKDILEGDNHQDDKPQDDKPQEKEEESFLKRLFK